jgi:multiple sugar transport system substrate-binding protein
MREIEFSTMFGIGPSEEIGDNFFDSFTANHQVKVKPWQMDWPTSWNELVQFGLNSHGPDISEVGTTWLGSFHTMEALRLLTESEIAIFGGEKRFPPAIWRSIHLPQNNKMLAIPWTLDVRVVLYRRDWLQKAGVDEATAFADSDQFHETLKRIKAAGHPMSLGISTSQSHTQLDIS